MYKVKSTREIIVESSIIISSLLIFFGFLKQYWFYDYFGLKIQQYLGFDEILISFFGELPFILKLVLYTFLYFFCINILFKIFCYFRDRKKKNIVSSEVEITNTLEEYINDNSNLKLFLIISLVLNFICFFLFIFFPSEVTIIYLALVTSQSLIILFDFLNIELEKILKDSIAVIVYFTIVLFCKNKIDIHSTINQYKEREYMICLKEEVITTNKNILFLGKTKDFIFFYIIAANKSRIIKSEDVKDINIKSIKFVTSNK